MTALATTPGLYIDALDDQIIESARANRIKAKRHLARMDPERRAELDAEWTPYLSNLEDARQTLADMPAERRAQLERDWENRCG